MKNLITKYFSKHALPFIEKGSFRFGTLQSYRATEQQLLDRMSDDREGVVQCAIHPEEGHISQAVIQGITFENCTFVNCGVPIMVQTEINDFVFCASIGGYDKSHHEHMLTGNPDLTEYAILDLDLFIRGIRFSAPHQYNFNNKTGHPWLLCGHIIYDNPQVEYHLPSSFNFNDHQSLPNEYERTVFCKPQRFSHEKELRIVIRPNAPYFIPLSESHLTLEHRKLRESIVQIKSINS